MTHTCRRHNSMCWQCNAARAAAEARVAREYRSGVCCPPTDPPSNAAYNRHHRAGTVPCSRALADPSAYVHDRKQRQENAS